MLLLIASGGLEKQFIEVLVLLLLRESSLELFLTPKHKLEIPSPLNDGPIIACNLLCLMIFIYTYQRALQYIMNSILCVK